MTDIVGRLRAADVMAELADVRPVFHSEADFQFALARVIERLAPDVDVRLEVPFRTAATRGRSKYVDLVCRAPGVVTAVELKYFTRAWAGTDGISDELFELRNHAATDLARLYFVSDLVRLEDFCADGLATPQPTDSRSS